MTPQAATEIGKAAAPVESLTQVFRGGGELGDLIRRFDWSETVLGPAENWPESLKTAVRICLGSRYPIVMWWGKSEFIQFYNDGYISVLGAAKHPRWLGRSGRECWAEIWPTIGPMLAGVFETGEATWSEDLLLVLDRSIPREEGFFTFSYSPLPDDDGNVAGIFCAVTETTGKVVSERRLRTLRDLGATVMQGRTAVDACQGAVETLASNRSDVPFAMIYLLDRERRDAHLAAAMGLEPGSAAAPKTICMSGETAWPFSRVLENGTPELVPDIETRFGALPGGPWPESPDNAIVVPISTQGQAMGFLVAGLSPRRILDADYRSFFDLVAGHIATGVANARAYEEERKRAEALAEIDRAKTAFFSNVSHEFRTPLTLMLGPLENLLSKGDGFSPDQRQEIETAHRNSLRLLKLVNSLLDFSRIEAGRMKASFMPVDLSSLTADLTSNFRSAMEAAGLELIVDCTPLPQPVYVDRDMWEKIVLNLLSNAFKFTLKGSITVCTRSEGNRALLTVCDTGTGIPEAELPRIFERFHRVEGAKGRTYEGSGIGLALIKELVKLHGGAVEVTSRIGEGSSFTVSIPYGQAHLASEHIVAPASTGAGTAAVRPEAYTSEALTWVARDRLLHAADDEPVPEKHAGPRPRILLADDNADMREHVARILGDKYELVTVAEGQSALEEARRTRPDLILSDVMMPGLDGFGLLSALRADPEMLNVPFIMLSARAGEEARSEGMEAGADDYVIKPFTARELLTRISAHLKLARTRREANERERIAHEEAAALNEVARALGSELDVQNLVQTVTDIATKLTGAKFGAFFYNVLDERGESFMLYTLSGASREDFEKFGMMPRNTPVFNTTFSGLGPRRSDDIRKDPDYGKMSPHFGMPKGHLPVCSYLAVPVKSRSGEVLGGLFFGHPEPGVFTETSERLASGIASHAAIAVDNARLYQKAEHQARASMLLASIVDSSDDAIISKDLNGVITSWNKSAERLFGYTAEEAVGKTVAELLIPTDRLNEESNILARLRRGERVDHFETVRKCKDGNLIDISLTISPVKDAKGCVIGASKIARDISQQRRARAAIENLNAQLGSELDATTRLQELSSQLMDFGDVAALLGEIIDVAMKVTAADMGNIQLLEGGVLKIISQRGFDTDFLEFFNRVEDSSSACGSAMESGQRVIIEDVTNSPIFAGTPALTAMLRAGARAVQSTPLITRGGELIGMLSTHYKNVHRPSGRDLRFLDILARQTADIIERQRAEQALRTSEERLRLAQKAAKVGAFEWDIQTGVNTWSPELEELYGLEHGSFGGTQPAWEGLVHPEDRETAVKKVEEGLKTGMPMESEWRVIWPDGSIHWLAGRFQVYRDAQGVPLRMSGVNFEITERKRMETELRRANHDLEQFAYSASHDLQEPLRSVKIFSELLSSRYGTQLDNEALEFLNNVRDGARRMEMLVRDLLAYNQASTSEEATAAVDANAAMEAAIANLAGAIAETGAKVDFDPLPAVRVQSIHLQQVFQNLIGNAIKYRRSGVSPVVHAKVQREGGNWHFSISDNGIGIEPQFQEKIFGLFKRLHTGDEYSGTGIGLALCQRIVERHHGRIWVESELGKGSVFHFTFPV